KGVMKAVARVPHRIRGETTHDTEFDDLNARFSELSKKTERLHSDAIKFRDAVSGMLNYQANFAEILEEIYTHKHIYNIYSQNFTMDVD
ncbi:9942_t:CDS:2, partial [Ambispora leptoticha]